MNKSNFELRIGLLGLGLLGLTGLAGALADSSLPHDLARAFHPPSLKNGLGYDAYGVSLGHRILTGAWHSLWVSALVTAITLFLGLVIGTAAALGPKAIQVVSRNLIDCFLGFPGLLLAILIASIMPHNNATLVFSIAATGWTGRARFCQALLGKLSHEPHIEAARAQGASLVRILSRHLWPLLAGQLLIQASLAMGQAILAEASLSFLGLGGNAGNESWGTLISEGRDHLIEAPHISLIPGVFFVIIVLAFTLTAEGLRKELDPNSTRGYTKKLRK
ncbi:MAG: ABC transporter permease [Bdellovibrionota bacterium]